MPDISIALWWAAEKGFEILQEGQLHVCTVITPAASLARPRGNRMLNPAQAPATESDCSGAGPGSGGDLWLAFCTSRQEP